MSPTPVSFASPVAPASYAWEATSEEVASRYGLPLERVARFDLNTAPVAPGVVRRVLSGGRFETPASEYPPSDYRRLVAAAARRYGVDAAEILVGAGADEILDIVAKALLPPGGRAVIPGPTYAMYRVLSEQRGAAVSLVPRLAAAAGHALDVAAVRAAARDADLVWLCSPNNPTALPEPPGSIRDLLEGLAADAAASGRDAPPVVLDEAYAEFVGSSLVDLRSDHPGLVVVRTLSKAYGLAGIRVGFAIASRAMIARLAPYRPPGSVSVLSVDIARAALSDDALPGEAVGRIAAERERLAAGLAAAGWAVGPSVTNFLLVGLGSAGRAAAAADSLLRLGLVPRTFDRDHPLADHLRITVRAPADDDRLVAAARAFGRAGR